MRLTRIAAPLFAAGLAIAGCSSPTTNEAQPTQDKDKDTTITLVASTQVWADIAKEVDPNLDATAIISGDETDPHSFEPTAQDMAKAKEADIVLVGGGGYDAWLYSAIDHDKIIHALPLTEHDHDHEGEHAHEHEGEEAHHHDHEHEGEHAHEHEGEEGHHHDEDSDELNEHVWYDIDAVDHVAEELAKKINSINPDAKASADAVKAKLAPIHDTLSTIGGKRVAQTEPIADYIIEQTSLQEVTPAGYRHATLDEQEPSASDVAAFLALIENKDLDILIYNPQTETPTTQKIKKAAEDAGITIVNISETPAKGENFFTFYADEAGALAAAAKN